MNEFRELDRQAFLLLNSLAGRDLFTNRLVVFFGRDFPYLLAGGFALFGVADYMGLFADAFPMTWVSVAMAFLAAGIARAIVEAIAAFYNRQRPFEHTEVRQLIFRDGGAAFPSGHAAFFFAFAAAITLTHPIIGIFLLLSAFAISLARIVGGVHWPGDVLAGIVIGILAGLALPWLSLVV